jgi:release factor glutamine methyltransferase
VRILEVINKTVPFFEKQGIENPRLNIELLLAHVLQKRRLDLYLQFERELDEATLARLRELVRRRAEGEPVQYVTGEAPFYGLTFAVNRHVLIPRPETELLVEAVLKRVTNHQSPITVVDVGTGSGCIAVTLAKQLPAAQIVAVDASGEALAVARANARRHGVEKNTRFLQGDLVEALPDNVGADVVVSNPPYIASGDWATLPKEVRDFEPVQALIAGADGLEVIRRLVKTAKRVLSPSGFVALEIGAGQRAAVEQLFGDHGYGAVEVVKDLQGHERVLLAQATV